MERVLKRKLNKQQRLKVINYLDLKARNRVNGASSDQNRRKGEKIRVFFPGKRRVFIMSSESMYWEDTGEEDIVRKRVRRRENYYFFSFLLYYTIFPFGQS